MRTNSVTHITTVLFLALSTWWLITFSLPANTSGNASGGLDWDWYSALCQGGSKAANPPASLPVN